MRRARRHQRMPPDLTSLFDVLFIVIFACLIRAAAAQHDADAAEAVAAAPKPPVRDASVIVHVAARGAITGIDAQAVDVPLLAHSADPDVVETYRGDVCRVVALQLRVADLAKYVVIFALDRALVDLPHALYDGLHHDVERCASEQRGWAVIVAP